MDDSREPRSIADDPSFLASLSDLDRGLADEARPDRRKGSESLTQPRAGQPPTIAGPRPLRVGQPRRPLPPSIVSPFDALTMNEPPPAQQTVQKPDRPAELRPLIELFPPETPAERPERSSSQKCETFYGFSEKPFAQSTDPHFFFHSTPHDAVGQQLLTAVRKREGLVVLTGEIGTGKTTLCRTVIEQLDRRTLTSLITDPFVTGEDLLKRILVDFGVTSRAELARGSATRHELSTTLISFVDSLAPLEASAIVIIDEAQNLPSDVLEQVRILAEAGEASSLLQVVLVGQPSLTALLRRREFASLQQRVTVRATLLPLPPDEIDGYIMHRLAVAGGAPRVHFEEPALELIYRLSRGVPRVINLICARALERGFETSASVIDAAVIEAAAEDLDLGEPPSRVRQMVSGALAVAGLALCVGAGAGLAALVFHDAFARAFALWRR